MQTPANQDQGQRESLLSHAVALQAETKKLNAIFDSSPVAMLVLDDDLHIVQFNAAAAALASGHLSTTQTQRLGDALQCAHSSCGPEDCQQTVDCLLCPLRSGLTAVLSSNNRLRGTELTLDLLRDGQPRQVWLRIGVEPLQIANRRHLVVALDDITERKQAEAALRLKNLVFDASIAANSTSAIDGRLTEVNQAFLHLWGYQTKDQVIGKPIPDFLLDPEEAFSIVRGLERTGQWEGDYTARRQDGSTFIAHGMATVVRNEQGVVIGFQSAVIDVTERIFTERKLLELNERLEHHVAARTAELANACEALRHRTEQFRALAAELAQTEDRERRRIAQVLHENPQQLLVAAKFHTATIRSQLNNPPLEQAASEVMNMLDQANKALRSLTMELSPPILHDAGFTAGLHWLALWMAENYDLTVEVEVTAELKPMSEDLRILLFRAVRELLFNTVKHSGVKLARVTVEPRSDGLRITVRDNGKGFDTATTVSALPLSLGLFHLRERLALLDGTLDIASAPGHGTTVVIDLPLAESAGPRPELLPVRDLLTAERPANVDSNNNAIRLLIVDDHAVVRQGLMQMLSREPGLLIVGDAIDGLDAVDKAARLNPDVILMDISMPRLNGLEATRRITAELPAIRIIGLSMHAQGEMTTQMQAAGAKSYLVKDSPIDEIAAAIRNVMNQPAQVCAS